MAKFFAVSGPVGPRVDDQPKTWERISNNWILEAPSAHFPLTWRLSSEIAFLIPSVRPSSESMAASHPKLELRKLGNTGLKISSVGFGASPLGSVFGPVSEDDAVASVRQAFRLGINFFDTSPYVISFPFNLGSEFSLCFLTGKILLEELDSLLLCLEWIFSLSFQFLLSVWRTIEMSTAKLVSLGIIQCLIFCIHFVASV